MVVPRSKKNRIILLSFVSFSILNLIWVAIAASLISYNTDFTSLGQQLHGTWEWTIDPDKLLGQNDSHGIDSSLPIRYSFQTDGRLIISRSDWPAPRMLCWEATESTLFIWKPPDSYWNKFKAAFTGKREQLIQLEVSRDDYLPEYLKLSDPSNPFRAFYIYLPDKKMP